MLNAVIDISDNQDYVNFTQVAADGIVGLFHKATQGTGEVDKYYASRKPLALSVGLLWGAFHYGTDADGTAQAQHFLATAAPTATDLIMLDFEDNSGKNDVGGTMTVAQAEAFVQYVQQQTGRYPGLYATDNYLVQTGAAQSAVLANCWLWVARYDAALQAPTYPPAWPTWTMWQYTDGTHGGEPHAVNGIGNCDRDIFNGPLDGLYRLWNCPPPAGDTPA